MKNVWKRVFCLVLAVAMLAMLPVKTARAESSTVEDFVNRLYTLCLNREPDAKGMKDWCTLLYDGNTTGTRVAHGFVFSDEFIATGYSDEEFVRMMYRVFLDREYDAEGMETWLGVMRDSGYGREAIFNGFSQSVEFGGICTAYGIEQGGPVGKVADDISSFVIRFYQVFFGRGADPSGLRTWTTALKDRTMSASEVASGFVFSDEFLRKNCDDATFVKYMYTAFLDRGADEEGLQTWTDCLRNGWTREQVFEGFVDSNEFARICDEYGISREGEEQEVTPVPERSEMILFIESEDVPYYDYDWNSENIDVVYNRIVSSAMRYYIPEQDTVRMSENEIFDLAERLLEVPGISYIKFREIRRLKNNSEYGLELNGWVNVLYAYLTGDESVVSEGTVDGDVLVAARQVMNMANEFSTQYEKEKFIHDYLVENTEYGFSSYFPFDAYGALVDKECVCAGFSDAFELLMAMAGIDCISVSGEAFNGKERAGHGWNKVKIDGEWYNVDVTWDLGYPKYEYFNVTDEYLSINHFWDNTGLPVCCEEYGIARDGEEEVPGETPSITPTPDEDEEEPFDAKAYYGDVNVELLYGINSDEFTLYTSELALKMTTARNARDLGGKPVEAIPMQVQVINYETGEIVYDVNSLLGETIGISDLPDGVYYYIVRAEGYKIYVPEKVFRLKYTDSENKSNLPWGISLEKKESGFTEPFRVQLQDENGVPVSDFEISAAIQSKYSCSSMPITSDENGFLTSWIGINGVIYYEIIDFEVADGYRLELRLNEDRSFLSVEVEDGLGICTIPSEILTPTTTSTPRPDPAYCEHEYEVAEVVEAATDYAPGLRRYCCSICGDETESSYALPHLVDIGNGQTATVYGYWDLDKSEEMLRLLNAWRVENGVPAVQDGNNGTARTRALECAYYYSYTRPNGERFCSAFETNGGFAMAEGIAAGYSGPEELANSWINFYDNKAMLNERYQYAVASMFVVVNDELSGEISDINANDQKYRYYVLDFWG